jgi:hypothetical protein
MQVVDKLPFSWVGNFHHIHSFISTYIAPSLAFSSAKMGVRGSLTDEECLRLYGMSRDIWDEVGRLQGQWQGREDVRFVLSYLFLCLDKWGVDLAWMRLMETQWYLSRSITMLSKPRCGLGCLLLFTFCDLPLANTVSGYTYV